MKKLDYSTAATILGLDDDLGLDQQEQRMVAARVAKWIADYGEEFVREKRDVFLCNFANMGLIRLAPGKVCS